MTRAEDIEKRGILSGDEQTGNKTFKSYGEDTREEANSVTTWGKVISSAPGNL